LRRVASGFRIDRVRSVAIVKRLLFAKLALAYIEFGPLPQSCHCLVTNQPLTNMALI
jgi:hypothetical protein